MAETKKPSQDKRKSIIPMVNFLFITAALVLYLQPAYLEYQNTTNAEANFNACRHNIDEIHKSIEKYRKAHNGAVPNSLSALCSGKDALLSALPTCPAVATRSNSNNSSYENGGYKFTQVTPFKPAVYTIQCSGDFHENYLGVRKAEPYFSSLSGLHPSDYEIGKRRHLRGE